MRLFDSHCHLNFDDFAEDRADAIERARKAGINAFMLPGVCIDSHSVLKRIASRYQGCFFALGLHPYFIKQHSLEHIELLQQQVDELLQEPNSSFKALGEMGLDATCDNMELQQQLLREQLRMAKERQLPVILHHRKTLDKTLKLVRESGPQKGVIHAFSGSYEQGKAWVEAGYFLGIGGTITYPRANKTRDAVARLPLSAMVLETDSPDMPVNGHQGQRNEPLRMLSTLRALAKLKDSSESAVGDCCYKNTEQLFNL
ncbi:MAG: TatD family hydrolase [Pseudomonadota bacterium]